MSKRAVRITLDRSHPTHSLFEPLPSDRRYRALSTRTTKHRNSFFPHAIHLINTFTINVEHTTLLYIIYLPQMLNLISICIFHTCTCIIFYIIFCVVVFFLHFLWYICTLFLSESCPVAVILLHCGAYNKFLVCVNMPANKSHSHHTHPCFYQQSPVLKFSRIFIGKSSDKGSVGEDCQRNYLH